MKTIISTMSVITKFVWFVLLFHGFTVALDLEAYIKKKEDQVKLMAAEIVRLDGARCALVANCSKSSCSRHACTPIEGFDDLAKYNFSCQQQENPNKYCSSSGGNCNSRQVNYAMSYIWMAPNAALSQMCSTICMTRDFTSTLKDQAKVDQYDELYYFGSIDGVFRTYPGDELANTTDDNQCIKYDPRSRGWYNGAISVQTQLIVLIDNTYAANYFRTASYSPLYSATKASIKIVQELIRTPSSNDTLDVITFNEENANAITKTPVIVGDGDGSGELTDGRNVLPDRLTKIRAPQSGSPTSTGFVKAISTALESNRYNNDSRTTVILVFTNGQFATDLQRQPVSQMLNNHSTKLFIYSFEKSDNLQALANESSGIYYEQIQDNFDNPLYQIRSFFDFMALARNASTKNNPYWTKFYEDFEGRGNITSVSYQALSPEGHLLGVVGIDITLKSVLKNLRPSLGDIPGSRPTNPNALIDARVGARSNSCEASCDESKAVCPKSSDKSFTELYCCNTCPASPERHSSKKWIAAVVVVGLVVMALIITSMTWWRIKKKRSRSSAIPNISSPDVGPYR